MSYATKYTGTCTEENLTTCPTWGDDNKKSLFVLDNLDGKVNACLNIVPILNCGVHVRVSMFDGLVNIYSPIKDYRCVKKESNDFLDGFVLTPTSSPFVVNEVGLAYYPD